MELKNIPSKDNSKKYGEPRSKMNDELENHRKYLYSFYSACSVLKNNSEDIVRKNSFEDDCSSEDYKFCQVENEHNTDNNTSCNEKCKFVLPENLNTCTKPDSLGKLKFDTETGKTKLTCNVKDADNEPNVKDELTEIDEQQINDKTGVNLRENKISRKIEDDIEGPDVEKKSIIKGKCIVSENNQSLNKISIEHSEYICHHCRSNFKLKSTLRTHIMFKCFTNRSREQAVSRSRNTARKHNHSDKNKIKFGSNKKCQICGHVARKPCELIIHMVKHTGEPNFECKECKRKFCSKSKLNRHIKNKVHEKGKFFCDTCKIYFSVEINFHLHVATHALPDDIMKPFCCEHCQKRFGRQDTLRKHIVSIHTRSVDGYKCTQCCRTFSRKDALSRHTALHCS